MASYKFFMGDKLREEMEGGKREETIFSALYCAHLQIVFLNSFENCGSPSKIKPCTLRGLLKIILYEYRVETVQCTLLPCGSK
jgi:hypothetical protein